MSGTGTGTAVSGAAGGGGIVTAPAFEPVTLAELKLHLRIDSGSFEDNVDESQLIIPGSHAVSTVYTQNELMTLDVAPGGAGWSVGDTVTGATSAETCVIVEKFSGTSYTVWNRTGTYTLGEILTNGVDTADQGAAFPTFAGNSVDVLGYTALVVLDSGINLATGTNDVKIQESDDAVTFTDWTGGAFTQVTTANDSAVQEIAYTGTKQYIRTLSKVLLAACSFGTFVIRLTATTIEDDLLNADITAAREHVEDMTRRAIITQTWDFFLNEWPAGNSFEVPNGNLQSGGLTLVYFSVATDGTKTTNTMDLTDDYLIESNGEGIGRIVLPYAETWPSFTKWPSQPIRLRYVCGWTTRALVPYKIKQAILMICEDLYRNRESQVLGIINQAFSENITVDRLLASARLWM